MLVTIRARESGTYVSRVEVRAVEVFCPVLETNKGKVKSLHVDDDEVVVTTSKYREAVELFDALMREELKERDK